MRCNSALNGADMSMENRIIFYLNNALKKHADYQDGMSFTSYEITNGKVSFSYKGGCNKQIFLDAINKSFGISLTHEQIKIS